MSTHLHPTKMGNLLTWYRITTKTGVLDQIYGDLDTLIQLPLNEQANYADHILGDAVDDKRMPFLKRQLGLESGSTNNERDFRKFSSTSIGNLAYIVTYYNGEEKELICSKSIEILDAYKRWYFEQRSTRHSTPVLKRGESYI